MEYNKILKRIQTASRTFIPALLIELVKLGYEKKVFQPFGASNLVKKIEKKLNLECPYKHELHQDKDDACPVCGEPFNPNF